MSRYDTKPTIESAIARLHLMEVLDNLGQQPQGIYIVTVPGDKTEAEYWLQPALALAREFRDSAKVDVSEIDFDDESSYVQSALDAVLLTSDGLYSGFVGSRCQVYLTDEGHADLRHPSVRLADGIIDIELRPELVALAAAEHGRSLSLDEAQLLCRMPRKARRLAFASPRPISESYDLHEIAACQEAKLAAAAMQAEKSKKKGAQKEAQPATGVALEDLFGYGAAKDWGLEVVRDLKDFKDGHIDWKDVDGAVLLSGPPGCGKTTFAKALAVSASAHFVSGSYSEWQSAGHQGDMLAAMRAAFDEARRCAPSVLLVDEVDAFVARGGERHDSYLRGIVNGFLELLDGSFDRSGVVVVAATNDPDCLDPAVRRSGRLDRHIQIGLPDEEARTAILAQHLGVSTDDFPLGLFRRKTEGMSGADLERLARDARRIARRNGGILKHSHLAKALPRRVARTPENVRLIAVHEIGHAVVGVVLGIERLAEVRIKRDYDPNAQEQTAGAACFEFDPLKHRDKSWFASKAAQLLGGMAAEQVVYGSHGTGAIADLSQASRMLAFGLTAAGLGETLVSSGRTEQTELEEALRYDHLLAHRVDEILQDQLSRAQEILQRNRVAFNSLVEALVQGTRLSGADVEEALRSHAPTQLSQAM
ncbi:AAA family ATPase [Rhizobiales bacterium RZME27]|uniref:AAA family ATPase n=1 Tax=Endobacterium cereale TaxID=2663029 RepID=A0A6A8A893_9HYPH|nr:AAA family ATPase [Endobacterium cereale]MQY46107.1 AAA family ATPase [Endobacterium cereale]